MPEEALELIKLRNNFYRDNYRRLATAVLISLVIIIFLSIALIMTLNAKPQPKYFATTDDGRILPLVPLNIAYKSTPQILQWATDAAVAANSYDFVNYRKQLQGAANFFTPMGWQAYMKALSSSGNLEAVKEGRVIATAEPVAAPQVAEEGLLNGIYYWKVTLPILVVYRGPSMQQKINFLVTMTLMRVSTLSNPSGVGVQQMVLEQQNA